jgi:acetolactate synthase I/II/III large subunit
MASRAGGHLLIECLKAAGVDTVFGVPGIHALAAWDGLAESDVRFVGLRTELSAGFAADGYARASRRAGVLFTTTGPGCFVAAAALSESQLSHVPLVNIVTQIPRKLVGAGRGYLHETDNQTSVLASFAKRHELVGSPEHLAQAIHDGVSTALSAPQGPVVIEVPVDVLSSVSEVKPVPGPAKPIGAALPSDADLDAAARMLVSATNLVLIAGGGVLRSGAAGVFTTLAERLAAPALTTYQGKGAISAEHPLSGGSGCYEGAYRDLIEQADVVLAVGTELGSETTSQWTFQFPGNLIHIDARADHIGRSYPSFPLVGDARPILDALLARCPTHLSRDGAARARRARERVSQVIGGQNGGDGLAVLAAVRSALGADGIAAWDMTIAGYMAASYYDVLRPDTFLYPLGSGTLGYAWPAAIGAKLACPDVPVMAVHGDGGVLYNIVELATAAQYGVRATLLVIDDGGYGILRAIQDGTYGRRYGVDLHQPDFPALARAMGVKVRESNPAELSEQLRWSLADSGPTMVHLPCELKMPERSK